MNVRIERSSVEGRLRNRGVRLVIDRESISTIHPNRLLYSNRKWYESQSKGIIDETVDVQPNRGYSLCNDN